MEHLNGQARVLRYVLASNAVKFAAGTLVSLVIYFFNYELPINSTSVTILSAGVGIIWFARTFNRPMERAEIVRFAVGMMLVDIVISIGWAILMILIAGSQFTLAGLDAAVFGSSGSLTQTRLITILIIGLIVGSGQVFLLSAFLAWLLTRKLPKLRVEEE